VVGVGRGVEVFLGGLDVGVPEAVHDRGEVGAAGQQPGGVGVAQVVVVPTSAQARLCRPPRYADPSDRTAGLLGTVTWTGRHNAGN
jgi:hypothetical protein